MKLQLPQGQSSDTKNKITFPFNFKIVIGSKGANCNMWKVYNIDII